MPSGETASAAIGPLWPSSTLSGSRLALRPDRDMRVGAGGGDAAVLEPGDRVHRAVVEAHHLLGDVARQRPADRRGVEAAGDGVAAVGRDRQRPHRPAMAAQLRLRRARTQASNSSTTQQAFDPEVHLRAGCMPRARDARRALVASRKRRQEGLHRRPLRAALDQQEIVMFRRQPAGSRGRRASPPARWRRPSRRGLARSRRPPRCATSAGWRSRAAARLRAACRSARGCRRRHCG